MAVLTNTYVCDNSSLTNFKSWAQAISTAFSTFGWTQTTDTGQVNWSTIASVPSSTYVYEVWKAADSLATSMPIYVKVEYGYSSTAPLVRFTAGTSSNGSGTITGNVINNAPWQMGHYGTNGGSTVHNCWFSGSAGEFRCYMWQNPGNLDGANFMFCIERSKDTTGANTGDYVTVVTVAGHVQWSTQQSFSSTVLFPQLGFPNNDSSSALLTVPFPSTPGSGAANGTVAAMPCFPFIGKLGNPILGLMTAVAADASDGSTVTVASLYGSTHTYIAYTNTYSNWQPNAIGQKNVSGTPMALLVRYE